MKTVYDIIDGTASVIIPSPRDPNTYHIPKGKTLIPPPKFDPSIYQIKFENNYWQLTNLRTDETIEVHNSVSPMELLRKERNFKLNLFDKAKKKFDDGGTELPTTWEDYRKDLLNLPQQIEAGLADQPKIVGGNLIYDDWPIPPF
jgi:hypothetical protein